MQKVRNTELIFTFYFRFLLHSIGVILLKSRKHELFRKFLNDILSRIRILSLPANAYEILVDAAEEFKLDFDDAYQYAIAKQFNVEIATMDQDFKRVEGSIDVLFL